VAGLGNEKYAGNIAQVVRAFPRSASFETWELRVEELELCWCSVHHRGAVVERAWAFVSFELDADAMADPI
jgi:hypothetical protein